MTRKTRSTSLAVNGPGLKRCTEEAKENGKGEHITLVSPRIGQEYYATLPKLSNIGLEKTPGSELLWKASNDGPHVDDFLLYYRSLTLPYQQIEGFTWISGRKLAASDDDIMALKYLHKEGYDAEFAKFKLRIEQSNDSVFNLNRLKEVFSPDIKFDEWQRKYAKHVWPIDLVRLGPVSVDEVNTIRQTNIESGALMEKWRYFFNKATAFLAAFNNWSTDRKLEDKVSSVECQWLLRTASLLPLPELYAKDHLFSLIVKAVFEMQAISFEADHWLAKVSDVLRPHFKYNPTERPAFTRECSNYMFQEYNIKTPLANITALEFLLKEGESLYISIPEIDEFKKVIAKCEDWDKRGKKVFDLLNDESWEGDPPIQLEFLEDLVQEGKQLPVATHKYRIMNRTLMEARRVKCKIDDIFNYCDPVWGRFDKDNMPLYTVESLQDLYDEAFFVGVCGYESFKRFTRQIQLSKHFEKLTDQVLRETVTVDRIQYIICGAAVVCIDTSSKVTKLKNKLKRSSNWVERVKSIIPRQRATRNSRRPEKMNHNAMKALMEDMEIIGVEVDFTEFRMVKELTSRADSWIVHAYQAIEWDFNIETDYIENLIQELQELPVVINEQHLLMPGLHARIWNNRKNEALSSLTPSIEMNMLKSLFQEWVELKKSISELPSEIAEMSEVHLDVTAIRNLLNSANSWLNQANVDFIEKIRTSGTFSYYELLTFHGESENIHIDGKKVNLNPELHTITDMLLDTSDWIKENQLILSLCEGAAINSNNTTEKITLNAVHLCIQQAEKLKYGKYMKECKDMRRLLARVQEWQNDVQSLFSVQSNKVNMQRSSLKDVELIIKEGCAFVVDLSEEVDKLMNYQRNAHDWQRNTMNLLEQSIETLTDATLASSANWAPSSAVAGKSFSAACSELESLEQQHISIIEELLADAHEKLDIYVIMPEEGLLNRIIEIFKWTKQTRNSLLCEEHGVRSTLTLAEGIQLVEQIKNLEDFEQWRNSEFPVLSDRIHDRIQGLMDIYRKAASSIAAKVQEAEELEESARVILANEEKNVKIMQSLLDKMVDIGIDSGESCVRLKLELDKYNSWLSKADRALRGPVGDNLKASELKKLLILGESLKISDSKWYKDEIKRHIKLATKWTSACKKYITKEGPSDPAEALALISNAKEIKVNLTQRVSVLMQKAACLTCLCHEQKEGKLLECTSCSKVYHAICLCMKEEDITLPSFVCAACRVVDLHAYAESCVLEALGNWKDVIVTYHSASNPRTDHSLLHINDCSDSVAARIYLSVILALDGAIRVQFRTKSNLEMVLDQVEENLKTLNLLEWHNAEPDGIRQRSYAFTIMEGIRTIVWCAISKEILSKRATCADLYSIVAQAEKLRICDPALSSYFSSLHLRVIDYQEKLDSLIYYQLPLEMPSKEPNIDLKEVRDLLIKINMEVPLECRAKLHAQAVIDDKGYRHCICRGPDDGLQMIQCEGCDTWFHSKCIQLSESKCNEIPHYTCRSCASTNNTPYAYESNTYQGEDIKPSEEIHQASTLWPPISLAQYLEKAEVRSKRGRSHDEDQCSEDNKRICPDVGPIRTYDQSESDEVRCTNSFLNNAIETIVSSKRKKSDDECSQNSQKRICTDTSRFDAIL